MSAPRSVPYLQVAGAPLRVLVIAMETGRPGHHVTLARRYHQVVEESGNTAPDRRNPHMVGTTLALRTVHGLPLDPAMRHDLVDVGHGAPVHLFDTFALANVRLCSSTLTGTTQSSPAPTMTRQCARHLEATIAILEPTLCLVQGATIPAGMAPIITDRAQIAACVQDVVIGGHRTRLVAVNHPSTQRATTGWGWFPTPTRGVPYFTHTVAPALAAALGNPATTTTTFQPDSMVTAGEPARDDAEAPMYALWRTCHHYATPRSIPEASSSSLQTVLNAATGLPSTGKFGQFVARREADRWVSVGFVKDGSIKYSKPTQLNVYDLCRNNSRTFSNPSYPPLAKADHPRHTVDLDEAADQSTSQ